MTLRFLGNIHQMQAYVATLPPNSERRAKMHAALQHMVHLNIQRSLRAEKRARREQKRP